MNDLGQLWCILVSVAGSVYCLSLLRDGRRAARSLKEPFKSTRDCVPRKSVGTRVNWLCQLVLSGTFFVVTLFLLAGVANGLVSPLARHSADTRQQTRLSETVSIPGHAPVIVHYNASDANPSVSGIDCAMKPVSGDQLRGLLRKTPELDWLILAGTDITDQTICELHRVPGLCQLNLGDTQVGDQGIRELAKMKSLMSLYLDGTKITDDGLRFLADLRGLRKLSLSNTAVTDTGLRWLYSLDKLESLEIHGTGVTPEGIDRLKSELPGVSVDCEWRGGRPSPLSSQHFRRPSSLE